MELSTVLRKMDFYKFGFDLNTKQTNYTEYIRRFEDYLVSVFVIENMVTIECIDNATEIKRLVADRYVCRNQEDLDYLILFGRVGFLFAKGINRSW